MITCHVCGAQNDPGNRFCDQCGARLDATEATAPEPVNAPPTASVLSCPVCGAQVLPGQAFCDNCGADLRSQQPVETGGAPAPAADTEQTMAAPPPAPDTEETVTAPPPESEQTMAAPPPAPDTEETIPPPPPEPPEPPAPTPDAEETMMAPPPAQPAPAAAVPASAEERQQVEEEIARHQNTLAQMEQMIQTYAAGTAPVYLTAALDDARRALDEAEQKLAALPSGPDPAEVARLEEERARHQNTIAQMEQMIQTYAAGMAPGYLTAALDDARRALAQVEADLANLQSSAAPGTPAAPPAPGASAAPPAPVAPEAPGTEAPPALPAEEVAPPRQPQTAPIQPAAGPRLIVAEDGQELPLPVDKTEIIIGREDPVSHIFPEIDLTPFGGESGGVSRQHARLYNEAGQWTVTDLNSTNFTHLNNKRLEPNVPTPIEDGAQIRLGRVSLTFKLS